MKLKTLIQALFILVFVCCTQKYESIKIVGSYDKEALKEIKELKLDSLYVNLLDHRNVTDSEYKEVIKSWKEFHIGLMKFMEEENFAWNTADSHVKVYNKIYFDKKGTIDYYTFRISNKSIPEDNRREFASVLEKFSKEVKLDIGKDIKYSQCGATSHTVVH